MTSRISTLCSGCYMQVIKSLGHHLSGRWLHCTGGPVFLTQIISRRQRNADAKVSLSI